MCRIRAVGARWCTCTCNAHAQAHAHAHASLRSPWKRASRSDQSHASIASLNTPGSAPTQLGCIAVSVRYAAGMPELSVAGPSRRPAQACPSRPARDVKRAAASSSAGARRCSAPWDMIRPASWCVTAASDGHNREASCRASGRRVSTVHRMGMQERRTTARPTRCRVALARGREALAAREGPGQGYLQQPHTLGSLRQGSKCDICERVLRLQGDSASSRFLCSLERGTRFQQMHGHAFRFSHTSADQNARARSFIVLLKNRQNTKIKMKKNWPRVAAVWCMPALRLPLVHSK